MMEDLVKEEIVEVSLGAVVILKDLSESSLKIKVIRTSVPVLCTSGLDGLPLGVGALKVGPF